VGSTAVDGVIITFVNYSGSAQDALADVQNAHSGGLYPNSTTSGNGYYGLSAGNCAVLFARGPLEILATGPDDDSCQHMQDVAALLQ
jgi:hypothetical protein